MPRYIPESELVLNQDSTVYHLALSSSDISDTIIVVGDPARVDRISRHFDHIECKKMNREFVTHTGSLNGHRLSVLSTGIGTDNIDIVINELDALVNIDLKTRLEKEQKKKLNIIRIGTSGTIHADIPVDAFLIASHGLGLDLLMHYYKWVPNEEELDILEHLDIQVDFSQFPLNPYVVKASDKLFEIFSSHAGFFRGMTATSPGFFGPQGRVIRAVLADPGMIERLASFHYNNLRVTNFEMETAGIYGLGRILDHDCLSINAVIANRATKNFSKDPHKTVDTLIEKVLGILTD